MARRPKPIKNPNRQDYWSVARSVKQRVLVDEQTLLDRSTTIYLHEFMSEAADNSSPKLVRGLGLIDASMIVVGSMIGSGIFITSAESARLVGAPGWLLVAWALAGVLTITGALCCAELAAMMPRAGGQYVFSARSLWSSGRISFRLVTTARHSNRHHCRGRSCFCTLHGRARAAGLRVKLHYCADSSFWQLRHQSFDGAVSRDSPHSLVDTNEHARPEDRQVHSKHFYVSLRQQR